MLRGHHSCCCLLVCTCDADEQEGFASLNSGRRSRCLPTWTATHQTCDVTARYVERDRRYSCEHAMHKDTGGHGSPWRSSWRIMPLCNCATALEPPRHGSCLDWYYGSLPQSSAAAAGVTRSEQLRLTGISLCSRSTWAASSLANCGSRSTWPRGSPFVHPPPGSNHGPADERTSSAGYGQLARMESHIVTPRGSSPLRLRLAGPPCSVKPTVQTVAFSGAEPNTKGYPSGTERR